MNKLILFLIFLGSAQFSFGQDFVRRTFKDTRVINTHTVETLQKRKLDIRIGHRFGDLKGGWNTLYGLESAQDIMIGADYGITDDMTIGVHRTKGAGPLTQLINTSFKYRFLKQSDTGSPITATALGLWTTSTMQRDESSEFILHNFKKFSHRFILGGQVLIARKFSDRFSLQLIPSYIHRNVVSFDEKNGVVSLGAATRIQITKVLGIIADATFPFGDTDAKPAIGIGFEIDTGGHIFQINFTNARGISETDYIPNNQATWGDGQIGLGFTISRVFNL
jgi:hypothetical protein